MLKQILPVVALLFIGHSVIYGQPTINSFSNTANLIRERRPEIVAARLDDDTEKILASYPDIKKKFTQIGRTEDQTAEAILLGWQQVRLDSPLGPNKSIRTLSFVEFMTGEFLGQNGLVEFTSEPGQADLWVNGTHLGKTITHRFYPVGTLSVVCKMDGYADWEKPCPVAAGSNECKCQLTRAKD